MSPPTTAPAANTPQKAKITVQRLFINTSSLAEKERRRILDSEENFLVGSSDTLRNREVSDKSERDRQAGEAECTQREGFEQRGSRTSLRKSQCGDSRGKTERWARLFIIVSQSESCHAGQLCPNLVGWAAGRIRGVVVLG